MKMVVTTTAVQFYRWSEMDIEPEDIVWLAEFYLNQKRWNANMVRAAMMTARRYYKSIT